MTHFRIAAPLLAVALAASAGIAAAQTPAAPNTPPAAVGVTPGTAANAETKAVPRSDTATLVRTDKARPMAGSANNGAMTGTSADGSMATTGDAGPDANGMRARSARN